MGINESDLFRESLLEMSKNIDVRVEVANFMQYSLQQIVSNVLTSAQSIKKDGQICREPSLNRTRKEFSFDSYMHDSSLKLETVIATVDLLATVLNHSQNSNYDEVKRIFPPISTDSPKAPILSGEASQHALEAKFDSMFISEDLQIKEW